MESYVAPDLDIVIAIECRLAFKREDLAEFLPRYGSSFGIEEVRVPHQNGASTIELRATNAADEDVLHDILLRVVSDELESRHIPGLANVRRLAENDLPSTSDWSLAILDKADNTHKEPIYNGRSKLVLGDHAGEYSGPVVNSVELSFLQN